MADPSSEEEGLLREWAPLTGLLQQIPLKAQRGIFTHELSLTCVDALPDFIAVGTNLGLVYWYSRKKGDLQRLRCENGASAVTCVKVISTVDYMVAAGNEQGIVTVFQIPKDPPDSLPESMKPKRNKQVERYTISGLHTSPVTAIEWSLNGMKLFSGDKNGLVVLTEIDFYMHLSKSIELLNEKYEIVQLSYCQQLLLVSTTYRSIVCHRDDRWRVAQVGQKERKSLGKLGATFCPSGERPQELVVYASRPGLRMWLADKSGIVQQTLIYKETMMREHRHVPLINPAPAHVKHSRGDHTFGPLLGFKDGLLVTHSSEMVYVLDPNDIYVVAAVADLRRVQDVSVTKDEIFILEGDRSIIRVAYLPESGPAEGYEEDILYEPSTCELSINEVFIHVVGSPPIQALLSKSTLKKGSVWEHVATEMERLGYPMGENAAAKCLQKWNYMLSNYSKYKKTNKWNDQTECPPYVYFLDKVLNPEENGEIEGTVEVSSVATEETEAHEPESKKIRLNYNQIYDSDSLLSTASQGIENNEIAETSEVVDENGVYVDLFQDGNETVFYDDEHITVYPEGTNSVVSSEDITFPLTDADNNQSVYIVVTPSFADPTLYAKESEDEEVESEVIFDSPFHTYDGELLDGQTLSIQVKTDPDGIILEDDSELPGQPKVAKEPLRPVPTPAQALMALVKRIGRDERERDNCRRRLFERRFEELELTILHQNSEIQELSERAGALFAEWLQSEDSSDGE